MTGDTDSIMINTNSTDLAHVKDLGNQVKKEVNKLYRTLELEIDGFFKSMLLLKKKKYAALMLKENSDGTVSFEQETKGLDLVRRDWCELSKGTGKHVLELILSGEPTETVVTAIHEKMDLVALEVRENRVPIDQYVVTKGMNKAVKDYPDAKNQPHLQVALAMQKENKPVNVGDHIPYGKGWAGGWKQGSNAQGSSEFLVSVVGECHPPLHSAAPLHHSDLRQA